jgi:hypothetical protein
VQGWQHESRVKRANIRHENHVNDFYSSGLLWSKTESAARRLFTQNKTLNHYVRRRKPLPHCALYNLCETELRHNRRFLGCPGKL